MLNECYRLGPSCRCVPWTKVQCQDPVTGGSASESERKRIVELERDARATPVRGLGVGVTGPLLPYGLDSTGNWDKDGEYSGAGLSWNRK